jgi:hypothetical protein
MKKNRFLQVGAIGFLMAAICTSCLFQPLDTAVRASGEPRSDLERLALIKAAGPRIYSVEQLQKIAEAVLAKEAQGRSVTARSVTGVKKLELGNKRQFSGAGRSAGGDSPVEVYAFTTEDPRDGAKGFVLASTDNRVGNILAIIDGGDPADPEEPFLDFLYGIVDAHIGKVISLYEGITEADIKTAQAKARAARTADEGDSGYDFMEPGPGQTDIGGGLMGHYSPNETVEYAEWDWYDGHYAPVTTQWGRDEPYSDIIGEQWYEGFGSWLQVGSEPVAMAQIMGFHQWPIRCNLDEYIRPAGTSRYYNWSAMTQHPTIYDYDPDNPLDQQTIRKIGLILFELSARLGYVSFYPELNIDHDVIVNVFEDMGYTTPGAFSDYDYYAYTQIRDSIINQMPVMVTGRMFDSMRWGHAWLIDGVRMMQYFEVSSGDGTLPYDEDYDLDYTDYLPFVHCNMGMWKDEASNPGNGNNEGLNRYNGWYVSGLFDCNNVSHARSVEEEDSFDGGARWYNLDISYLPYIYH